MGASKIGRKRIKGGFHRPERITSSPDRKDKTVIPSTSGARFPAGFASRSRRAKGHRNTTDTDADVPLPTEVEVVDPTHPLYRRRFRVVSVIRESRAARIVRVEWRFGLTLLLPLSVTDIGAFEEPRTMRTKLSVEALEDLVAVAEASEGACLSSPETSGARCRPRSGGQSSTTSRQCSGR